METLINRITLNPDVCSGRPTMRNLRFTVAQLLDLLAAGMTQEEILTDYPYLVEEDVKACLLYASIMANTRSFTPLNAA